MKRVVTFQQNAGDLADGDVNPPFPQLFQQPPLGHVVLVRLQEDVVPQSQAEVRSQSGRKRRHSKAPVGQAIRRPSIPRDVLLDDQILDHEIAIAFQLCIGRKLVRLQEDGLINRQVLRFRTLRRSRSFPRRAGGSDRRFEQSTRLDLGALSGPLQPLNLLAKFGILPFQPLNRAQQPQHHRRLLGGRNLDPRDDNRLAGLGGWLAHAPYIPRKPAFE